MTIIERRQNQRRKSRGVTTFPSSSKLPRYLGLNPNVIEDESLREKLEFYVKEMGFTGLDDERIINMLNIDPNLCSRDKILALKENLRNLLVKD